VGARPATSSHDVAHLAHLKKRDGSLGPAGSGCPLAGRGPAHSHTATGHTDRGPYPAQHACNAEQRFRKCPVMHAAARSGTKKRASWGSCLSAVRKWQRAHVKKGARWRGCTSAEIRPGAPTRGTPVNSSNTLRQARLPPDRLASLASRARPERRRGHRPARSAVARFYPVLHGSTRLWPCGRPAGPICLLFPGPPRNVRKCPQMSAPGRPWRAN
jgi:hypothetical protein